MAFFCPIFPKNRLKSKEYEDSNYFSIDGQQRLYSSRSLTALNAASIKIDDEEMEPLKNDRFLISCDFEPTVDDEIRVLKGETVRALYRDGEWAYVVKIGDETGVECQTEGFVPWMFCESIASTTTTTGIDRKFGNSRRKASAGSGASAKVARSKRSSKSTRSSIDQESGEIGPSPILRTDALQNVSRFLRSLDANNNSNGDSSATGVTVADGQNDADYAQIRKEDKCNVCRTFEKSQRACLTVVFDFQPLNQDDLDVKAGEKLLLLNDDDPDWFWVRNESGSEGFVPGNRVRIAVVDRQHPPAPISPTRRAPPPPSSSPKRVAEPDAPMSPKSSTKSVDRTIDQDAATGNELIVVRDFQPEAADDLRVVRGDWIYSYQTVALSCGDWLWAYCPRTNRYGFVPSSVVELPTATKL